MNQLLKGRKSMTTAIIFRGHRLVTHRSFTRSFRLCGQAFLPPLAVRQDSILRNGRGQARHIRATIYGGQDGLCRRFSSSTASSAIDRQSNNDESESNHKEEQPNKTSLDSDEIEKRLEEKRRKGLRRVAAQSVPSWLKKEPFCFERTVTVLNLNMSTSRWASSGDSFLAMSNFEGQYRRAYTDSIVSFVDHLLSSDHLKPELEAALDSLVDVGFADVDFSQRYRSIKDNQFIHAHKAAIFNRKRKKYEELEETIGFIMDKVAEMELELSNLVSQREMLEEHDRETAKSEADRSTGPPAITSLYSLVTSASSNNSTSPDTDNNDINAKEGNRKRERLTLENKIQRQERKIEARKRHVESMRKASQNALESIERFESEENALRESIAFDDYQKTQQIVEDSLVVICDSLAEHIQQRHSTLINQYQNLDAKTDLTKPHEWYQLARLDKRKIIFHGGPTNSGKTYNALQRLKTAKRGLYLGPLRLLAAEIYETLNAQGVYTSLITGQEVRQLPFSTHRAATVEMAASLLEEEFDVVVIDEIQMIEDTERGFAWTRALMGMRCKEIHVCGGLEAKNIVKKITLACGDDFQLNEYKRFSELTVAQKSLATHPNQPGAYKWVRPADCIVAFSRNDIFSIKREIESTTPYKCVVVYGTLPPMTRTTQAQLFNDPNSGYEILIASDAISMGLNLNIRRIIFNSIYKNDGNNIIRLGHSAVKQLAGRAGRRNSPYPDGVVTCRDPRDLSYIHECLSTEIKPIEKAGLIPTASHIDLFAEAVQGYYYGTDTYDEDRDSERKSPKLHKLLKDFSDMAVVKGDYFLCRQSDMIIIARWLQGIDLDIKDKYMFCMAPIATNSLRAKEVIIKYAQKMEAKEVPGLGRGSVLKPAVSFQDLAKLCSVYSEIELFIWLQNKFPPINLMEQQAALARKERAASFINLGLQQAEKLKLVHSYIQRDTMLRALLDNEEEDGSAKGLETEEEEGEKIRKFL